MERMVGTRGGTIIKKQQVLVIVIPIQEPITQFTPLNYGCSICSAKFNNQKTFGGHYLAIA